MHPEQLIQKQLASATLWALMLSIFCISCQPTCCQLVPNICYTPQPYAIERLPTHFAKLTSVEKTQDWGKELQLGKAFAKEMDLYRALTCFKRALFLIPGQYQERRLEIEYDIFFAYYIANKYQEAVDAFETSHLQQATEAFPAYQDLLIALYDAYIKIGEDDKACRIMSLINESNEELAANLSLETAISKADFPTLYSTNTCETTNPEINQFLCDYTSNAKSVTTAKTLNALLPGAGYLYVGQKNSALTSFIINTLFIAAAYQLFDRGYIAGGIIVTSLESGWYLGGINGAGLEAQEYNRVLYEKLGRDVMAKNCLFPILMIQKGF